MGKKGSWFSALKRIFSSGSKEKFPNRSDKKKGKGILKHVEKRSFIHLLREPTSIEKILEDADNNQHLFAARPSTTPNSAAGSTSTQALPRVSSPVTASAPIDSLSSASLTLRVVPSSKVTSPRAPSPKQNHTQVTRTIEPAIVNLHRSATRIQATYRGYLARRRFRSVKGLVRLQGVVRSQNVQRQTMNAIKQMQLLVRVQTQIQSPSLQILKNEALCSHSYMNHDKEAESTLSKWTLNLLSGIGKNEGWDDSLLTKEEIEESLRKKVEAKMQRERALAYAYTHQWQKGDARSAQIPWDLRSNGISRWWKWMDPSSEHRIADKNNVQSTPSRSSPRFHNYAIESYESGTPSSSKSAIPMRKAKQFYTPTRTPTPNSSVLMNYKRPSTGIAKAGFDVVPINDTDSYTSCPPFSAPSYMAPTASAKAKLRNNSNPKERIPTTPGNYSKRRFSFSTNS